MPTLDEALNDIVNEEWAAKSPPLDQPIDFSTAFTEAALGTRPEGSFSPRVNSGIKRSSLQEAMRAAADPRNSRGARAAQYQSPYSNFAAGGPSGGGGAPPGYGGGPMASGLGPTGPGGVGGGGSATRSFAPYNMLGKGDAKAGFEFLENIATLGGGNKRLEGAIKGAKAGAGAINVLQKNNRYAQYAHTPGAGDSISRRNQFSVPTYGGSFQIMPSQGTEEFGHALNAMIQRAADIQYRGASKRNRRQGWTY